MIISRTHRPGGTRRCLTLVTLFIFCLGPGVAPASDKGLSSIFADDFLVGVALNQKQLLGQDPEALALVQHQFNAVVGENDMKWERIEPAEGEFDWKAADALVQLAEDNDMHVTGHVLVWHSQTPDWVFQDENGDPASREIMLQRMKRHIDAVAGRYRGRVHSWDVVNEALNDDGTLRESPWYQTIGPDFVEKAFEFAHAADPDAILIYNDYNLFMPAKRDGAVRLVKSIQEKGIPVHAVGMQGHYGLDHPDDLQDFEDSIQAFAELGQVMITELDMSVIPWPEEVVQGADVSQNVELLQKYNPYPDGLPGDVAQLQSERYQELFRMMLRNPEVTRVTFWGVSDGHTWRNDWPMKGRSDHPLFFDRELKPRQVYYDVVELKKQ